MSDLDKTLGRTGQSNQSPPGADVVESNTAGQLRKGGDFRDVAIPPGMEMVRKSSEQEASAKAFRISPPFEIAPAGGSGSQFIALAGEGNGRYQAPLDFEAHSLIVDNWSTQYAYFPTANKWVGPFQIDKVISVPRGCTSIDVKFVTPLPGTIALPAVVANQFMTVQAYEGFLAPSGGTDVSQAAIGIDTDTNIDQVGGTQIFSTVGNADANNNPATMPVSSLGLIYNGATWDRFRALSAVGDGLGAALASQPSSTGAAVTSASNAAGTITFGAVAGQQHRITHLSAGYDGVAATTTTPTYTVSDGTTILVYTVPVAIGATVQPNLPPGGIKFAVNTTVTCVIAAGGVALSLGIAVAAKLTA